GGMSVLGRILVGDDLKFLDRVLRHQTNGATDDVVVEVAAVHTDAGTARCGSAGDYSTIQALGGIVGRRRRHTRNQVCELLEVAVVDGEIGNLYLRNWLLDLRSGSVDL